MAKALARRVVPLAGQSFANSEAPGFSRAWRMNSCVAAPITGFAPGLGHGLMKKRVNIHIGWNI